MTRDDAVVVDGCEIRYRAAGSCGPELVLIHGGGAHAAWWQPVTRLRGAPEALAWTLSWLPESRPAACAQG